ncbi:MAG: sulfatase [bacterium]|nr:sulfatase [bacterium]
MKIKLIFLLIILSALILGGYLYFQRSKGQKSGKNLPAWSVCTDCNVVFVSFDDLRASRVGVLGYSKNTTPAIDSLAQKSFVFTNAITVAPWTLPSHMSMFTGVYPSHHRVLNKFTLLPGDKQEISNLKKLSPNLQTLAQMFRANGYSTGGFTGSAGVNHQFGFDQGFDVYTDDKDFAGFEETIPKALNWIKANKDKKMFVFLHGYGIHGEYVPPDGYDKRFVDFPYKGTLDGSVKEHLQLVDEGLSRGQVFLTSDDVRFLTALYDEKIQRADNKFGQFLKEYSDLGLMDKTIFVLLSDHGEELYEHGRVDHGHSLYDELVKIPLIIKVPGLESKVVIDNQARTIDLAPTILELAGIKTDEIKQQFDGESLTPMMRGDNQTLDSFLETDYRYANFLRGIRAADGWKLIVDKETYLKELYNLKTDPQEKKNLINESKDQAKKFYQKLQPFIGQ